MFNAKCYAVLQDRELQEAPFSPRGILVYVSDIQEVQRKVD